MDLDSDEDPDVFEARIETALMALFRDTRGEAEFQAIYDYARGGLSVWIGGQGHGSRTGPDPLELVQDTFVNIYRYAGSFRDEHKKSFRVWSRTIAHNLRRRSRMRDGRTSLQALPRGLQEPADLRSDPADALVQSEERRALIGAWMIVLGQYAAAWEKLGPRDRRALDLIEVQGLSYAEAGAHLHVGLSNMKMIMFRARRRVRAMIGGALAARETARRQLAV